MTPVEPPHLAEWLLRRLRRGADTGYLASDLAEGFVKRRQAGRTTARLWYWSQVVRAIWHHAPRVRLLTEQIGPALRDVVATHRRVFRRPGQAVVGTTTLALAVTAMATAFSVTHAVLIAPLPWRDADRLIRIWETRDGGSSMDRRITNVTLEAWLNDTTTVDEVATFIEMPFTVGGPDGAERIAGARVSGNLLSMLGAVPVLGRTLQDADVNAVVVSEPFARRQFGEGTDWIGRVVELDGQAHTVVGAVPAGLAFPSPATSVWVPFRPIGMPNLRVTHAVGRLTAGVSPSQAADEAQARASQAPPISQQFQAILFGSDGIPRLHAAFVRDIETARVRSALLASLIGMALLVATAMVSLIGLQRASAAEQRGELAVRAAIGASRLRIGALLVGEVLWWSLAGGLAALVLTYWALEVLPSLVPADFPRIPSLAFGATSFLAVAVTTTTIAIVVGVMPTWRATQPGLAASIVDPPHEPAARGWRSIANPVRILPTIQTAVAMVLLIGAGLVSRTLIELVREDLGYAPHNVVMARLIGTGLSRARGAGRLDPDTLQRLIARLEQLPGVTGVAMSTALPFQAGAGRFTYGFTLPDSGGSGRLLTAPASENTVTPGYFDLLGMRVVSGRALSDVDYQRGTRAIVVNQAFARAYLGDKPVGSMVSRRGEVVGVVEDIKDRGLAVPVDPQVFSIFDTSEGAVVANPPTIFIRTVDEAPSFIPDARALVRQVDERLGLDDVTTIQARLSAMVAEPRLYAAAAAASAVFAMLVAAVGLFGMLWTGVAGRQREIGVRVTLGATPAMIVRQVVGEGLATAGVGIAVGLASSALVVRYLRSLLYHVGPFDPYVFVAVPAVLGVVSVAACLLPARRAASVDPVKVLKAI